MRKLRNNRRDVMRADGRKRLDRLFDEFEFVDWEQRDVMREFMIEQSVTNTPGPAEQVRGVLRATYKQEYKPLTSPAKKAILGDFGKWSGGEDPAVCDEELVEKYLTFAVPALRSQGVAAGAERGGGLMVKYTEEGPSIEEQVADLLLANNIAVRACGLNADWCVLAWCLSDGEPNAIEGRYYLLNDEDTDDEGNELFTVVQRFYEREDPEWPGNNLITTIIESGPLERVLGEWVKR